MKIEKNHSLKVLFFSHSSGLTGSERSLLELVDELLEKDVLITVILPSDGPLKKLLDQRPIMTEIVPFNWWARGDMISLNEKVSTNSESQYNLLNFLPKLKQINPDVIYTNTAVIPWGAIAAMLIGKPHIWHIREYGKIDHNLDFDVGEIETKKFINATSNAVITNSNSIHNFYKDFIDEKKMTVAYNFIDIPQKFLEEKLSVNLFKSKKSVKLLIPGTIMPSKGQMDAVLATHQLIKKKFNVELVIIGQIAKLEYANKIKDYIYENKLNKFIHIHDFVSNPYPIIESSDIILTCSINEAFGRGTVEAMLLKKAVVATNNGGTIELIKDMHSGLLYKPGNYHDLTKKIEYLFKNKNKIKEFGENGYIFVKKNVTKENYGGKIFQLIKKVAKEKSILKNLEPIILSLSNAIVRNIAEAEKVKKYKKQLEEIMKLIEKNQTLHQQINQTKNEIQNLESILNMIKSAKFFKLWQEYNKIKKLIWK